MNHRFSSAYSMVLLLAGIGSFLVANNTDGGVLASLINGVLTFIGIFVVLGFFHFRGHKDAMHAHIRTCESQNQAMMDLMASEKTAPASITKAEQNIVEALMQSVEDFEAIGEEHSGELDHFENLMHDAIAMVFARVGMRSSLLFKTAAKIEERKT